IVPEQFLPIPQQFGISSRVALWVQAPSFSFISNPRQTYSGTTNVINLPPSTAYKPQSVS
ncbi:hypothetical protein, partial [Enterobacter hormaechei]